MKIKDHLDKENFHHAYLIEGAQQEIVPILLEFLKEIKIETIANPDFSILSYDTFKIDDARDLKVKSQERGFSASKKIYIISVNNILLEAQNTLLKMFEEPIANTHFFLIAPDADVLLPTLISRFYLIKQETNTDIALKDADKFIDMPLRDRITFLKDLLTEEDEDDDIINTDTGRAKALKFLNALESTLHNKYMLVDSFDINVFSQIFKVREFLRQPGSSAKSLMESIAIIVPIIKNN